MFARVWTFKGMGDRYDEGVEFFRDKVVPDGEKKAGLTGLLLLGDRTSGVAHSIAFWESEEAMQAGYEWGEQLAETAANQLHAEISVGHFEVEVSKLPALIA